MQPLLILSSHWGPQHGKCVPPRWQELCECTRHDHQVQALQQWCTHDTRKIGGEHPLACNGRYHYTTMLLLTYMMRSPDKLCMMYSIGQWPLVTCLHAVKAENNGRSI